MVERMERMERMNTLFAFLCGFAMEGMMGECGR